MNDKIFATAGKGVCAALLMAGATASAHAAPVVFFDFDGASGFTTAVDSIGPDVVSATNWTSAAGTIDSRAGVSGQAMRLAGWDANQFLEFKFTVAPNKVLKLSGLQFSERFGGVGGGAGGGGGSPQTFASWNFLVNGGEKAGANAVAPVGGDTFELVNQAIDAGGLSGEVTIRLTADAPFLPGSWFIDNFTLTGDFTPAPVPVPAAAWMLGSAVMGLAAMRRRAA